MSQQRPQRHTPGWVLGRVGGVPVVLAPSWVLVAAVLLLLYYPLVRGLAPQASTGTVAATTGAFVVMLFLSVLVHELAHGLTASRFGTRPREYVITFWGGHTAFERELPGPGASAVVSVAGPAANAALAGLAWAGTQAAGLPLPAWLVLWGAVISNVFVAAFNLLPGLPLDGGRVLEALVWRVTGDRVRGTEVAAWGGRVVVVTVVGLSLALPLLQGRRPTLSTVVWVALLGSFLWMGASQSLRAVASLRRSRGLSLRDLAVPAHVLPVTASLADVEALPSPAPVVLVDAGRPVGVLDPTAAQAVPAQLRPSTPLPAVARTLHPDQVLPALTGAEAAAAVARAQVHGPLLVVVDGGAVLGVVTVAAVARALHAGPGPAAAP